MSARLASLTLVTAAVAVFASPAFAGRSAGGAHSLQATNLDGFNLRQEGEKTPSPPSEAVDPAQLQELEPASGEEEEDLLPDTALDPYKNPKPESK